MRKKFLTYMGILWEFFYNRKYKVFRLEKNVGSKKYERIFQLSSLYI